ncbi:MAG: penicillin-binding protein 2 [Candidatus Nanopelagicales bacterium]
MTDRIHARLFILAALVMSLLVTLGARAFDLQVLGGAEAAAAAVDNRMRDLVLPAARGMVLDQRGRALATNRIALDVTVSRRTLRLLDDDGAAVLDRLAGLVGVPAESLAARLRNCGTAGAKPLPDCWNGAPGADPVVASDVGIEPAGQVMADPDGFPGIQVVSTPVRQYPLGSVAAQALGYVGELTAEDLASDPGLAGVTKGRSGLELQYDEALRGSPGLERVTVDSAGHRESAGVAAPAVPGQTLVTSIDAKLQAVVEQQLAAVMKRARARMDRVTNRPFVADGGAAVVLDVRTGAVLAMASAPTYDANLWTGGISSADYARLTDPSAGLPLLNRALQSALAPASTFKVVSTAAALAYGVSGTSPLPCPAKYRVGDRAFRNYESKSHGRITMARALEVSCDTIFYRIAHQMWRAGEVSVASPGSDDASGAAAVDAIANAAADFGFGRATGIDLPGEVSGTVASRALKQARWDDLHDQWCRQAAQGFPEVADPERAAYLTQLAQDNCRDGMRWRVGDALNASIGQGDTTATVLQLAVAYAAIANGGTLWKPRVGSALLDADGTVAARINPEPAGTLDVPAADLAYLRAGLRGVIESGSARGAFAGFPVDEVPLAGKTGTAEVYGRQATSWFASFAPADEPRYAVVMMVSQGGTGAGAAGRGVRSIYDALFGVRDGHADPARSVLAGGDVAEGLPTISPDGVPSSPEGAATGAATGGSAGMSTQASPGAGRTAAETARR